MKKKKILNRAKNILKITKKDCKNKQTIAIKNYPRKKAI